MDEIIAWLWMLDFWHWWAIGIVLIAVETFAISTFLLWPGISALVMGFIVFFAPDMDWRFQVILFAIMAVITSVGWQVWLRKNPTKSDHPNLNVRGASFIGRRVTLAEPLANGRGRIEIGDGWWTVSSENGESLDAGIDVEVVDSDGGTLTIKPVAPPAS
ncbi:MAG: NfeD family protein [Alphaproteobacteria bacterium]